MEIHRLHPENETLFAIAKDLLGGIEGITEENIRHIFIELTAQLKLSIGQLAHDLHTLLGFSREYAVLTASQVAPKPIFYSLLMRLRTAGLGGILASAPTEQQAIAFRMLFYTQLAPEFTVYLFDQNIDNYNGNYRENNALQRAIDLAATQLHTNPAFYLHELLSLATDRRSLTNIPDRLRPFSLLIPYIDMLNTAGFSQDEIVDVLYTVSDVITNEHLTKLAYSVSAPNTFHRYPDYVDHVTGAADLDANDSAEQTIARSLLRGEGHLMVVASHYLLQNVVMDYDEIAGSAKLRKVANRKPLREIISQSADMVRLVRLMESLVRVADDYGDVEIDLEANAANIFLVDALVKRDFLQLAGIGSGNFNPAIERFIANGITDREDYHAHLMRAFADIEEIGYQTVTYADTGTENRDDLMIVLDLIRAVVWGAKVNALYNDKVAAAIGDQIQS